MPRRSVIVLIILLALILAALGLRVWLARSPSAAEAFAGLFEAYPAGDRLVLKPADFKDLPGWGGDAPEEAVPVFLRSCRVLTSPAGDWQAACEAAAKVPPGDRAAARRFFETNLRPWSVRNQRIPVGLFTGYCEALLQGSLKRHGNFTVPIYARPPGAGDGRSRPLSRLPQGTAHRRSDGQGRASPLPGPQGDRRGLSLSPQAGDRLGERPWVLLPKGRPPNP